MTIRGFTDTSIVIFSNLVNLFVNYIPSILLVCVFLNNNKQNLLTILNLEIILEI